MSRIFEALQRAEVERRTSQLSEEEPFITEGFLSDQEDPQPDEPGVVLEDIVRHAWTPSIASFPTLANRGAGVEQFRSLRSRIYQARYESPLKTILISSGLPSEGKSFVAANLAMSLARNSDNNILLIDGDLRRPTLHSLLGAPNEPGLSEFLAEKAELRDIMQRDCSPKIPDSTLEGSTSNLTFIPAGKCGDNSSELVANRRIERLIAALAPKFDWILIDSPPVLAVTDAVEIAHAADAVLLVARGGETTFAVAQSTQTTFVNSRILGFVLNDVKDAPSSDYKYHGYYGKPDVAHRPR